MLCDPIFRSDNIITIFQVCADMGEIDGDRLANICFVGNFSTRSLQV